MLSNLVAISIVSLAHAAGSVGETLFIQKAQEQINKPVNKTTQAPPAAPAWEGLPHLMSRGSNWDSALPDVTILEPQQLDYVFSKLASLQHLAFGFTQDGCYYRAYEMDRILYLHGISAIKVVIVAKSGFNLRPKALKGPAWGWHIAPAVFVSGAKNAELRVIDPALSKKPLNVTEWQNLVNELSNSPFEIILVGRKYFGELSTLVSPATPPDTIDSIEQRKMGPTRFENEEFFNQSQVRDKNLYGEWFRYCQKWGCTKLW